MNEHNEEKKKKEIDIPQDIKIGLTLLAKITSLFFLFAATTFSFYISTITNINTIQQSLTLSIFAFFFLTFFQSISKSLPLIIGVGTIGPLIVFKVYFYHWICLTIAFAFLIFVFKKWKSSQLYSADLVILNNLLIVLALNCFQYQKYIGKQWNLFDILLPILLTLPFLYFAIKFIQFLLTSQNCIFNNQRQLMNFNMVILICFFSNLMALVSKIYISIEKFTFLIFFQFILSTLITVTFLLFNQEIALYYWCPKFSRQETIFRVHHRFFTQTYHFKTCQRNVHWQNEDCLLCSKIATIVNNNCGHFALCQQCKTIMTKKNYLACIICNQISSTYEQIDFEAMKIREGYQRKVFIEKKLHKNQFRIK